MVKYVPDPDGYPLSDATARKLYTAKQKPQLMLKSYEWKMFTRNFMDLGSKLTSGMAFKDGVFRFSDGQSGSDPDETWHGDSDYDRTQTCTIALKSDKI